MIYIGLYCLGFAASVLGGIVFAIDQDLEANFVLKYMSVIIAFWGVIIGTERSRLSIL